eukprot:TRINITY_DN1919_c0_g4_i1.p1 TRINITY_DN1919_c0_g4~~TRINITY_DN1919_c0_g4_i1.p1  ORF type:complete len:156 (+),score=51.02 TRINITY_DN1919_c0_g4_i1:96-563(+)
MSAEPVNPREALARLSLLKKSSSFAFPKVIRAGPPPSAGLRKTSSFASSRGTATESEASTSLLSLPETDSCLSLPPRGGGAYVVSSREVLPPPPATAEAAAGGATSPRTSPRMAPRRVASAYAIKRTRVVEQPSETKFYQHDEPCYPKVFEASPW